MIKNYTPQKSSKVNNEPSEQTIRFLLDFSKSLRFVNSIKLDTQVELNLN